MKRIITILLMALSMVVSMHAADEVSLNLSSSPGGAAVCHGSGVYTVGSQVYIYTRVSEGYVFEGWYEGQQLVSDTEAFNYTMPNHNVNLVAHYHYDPTAPNGPGEDSHGVRRKLILKCRPENSGTFNAASRYVNEDEETEVVAYTRPGFVFKQWEDEKGRILSNTNTFNFTMPKGSPEQNILTGVFEYNPEPPTSPLRNFLNPDTGEAIIDDFTEGQLSAAISELVNRHQGNTESITMLTVIGRISDNDYGIARYYPQCSLVDLSRTTGCDNVPSYAYSNSTALEVIALPASTKSIGKYAFENATALREIKCFATLPPELQYRAFYGMPDDIVVRVPLNSVALYKAAEGWKDYTILPFEDDVRSITFKFPYVMPEYEGCTISLIHEKSGLATRLIIDRKSTSYTFRDLPRNTSYIIKISSNNALACDYYITKPILLEENNLTIAMDEEHTQTQNKLYTIRSNVEGPAYSSERDLPKWFIKPAGSDEYVFVAQGSEIHAAILGQQMRMSVDLKDAGYAKYYPQEDLDFTLTTDHIEFKFEPRKSVAIEQRVVDDKGRAVLNPKVAFTYTLENGTSHTFVSKSPYDTNRYYLSIITVPGIITASADGYMTKTVNWDPQEDPDLEAFKLVLSEPKGAVINVRSTLTDITTGEAHPLSASKAEPLYTLERITTAGEATPIVNFSKERAESGVSLRLDLDAVQAGDKVRVTGQLPGHPKASDVCSVVLVDETTNALSATANINFKQLGGVVVSYDEAENDVVNALLFDEDGKLVGNTRCNENNATFANLPDGRYTLIAMGASAIIGAAGNNTSNLPTPSHLQQMNEMGYKADQNYIAADVNIKAGSMQEVHFATIPTQQAQVYGYITPESSFTVSKSAAVAGTYVTFSSRFDFKSVFADRVSKVRFICDLPTGSHLVNNSVMVGNELVSYLCSNDRLIVPLTQEQIGEKIRFVVIPTKSGDNSPVGIAAFELAGQETMQYIGQSFYNVSDLSINVPEFVGRTKFTVTGMATSNSHVQIYDNNTLIGSATALGNGHYSAECNLVNTYNGTNHTIWAQIKTDDGLSMKSVEATLYYDMFVVELSKVRMYNTAHTAKNLDLHEYETVFDFINPKANAGTYWYWPNYPEFTFLIDFNWQGEPIGTAQASLINNLILEVYMSNGTYSSLYPVYDPSQGTFVVKHEFSTGALPVSVRVFYEDLAQKKFDKDKVDDMEGDLENLFDELATTLDDLNSFYPSAPTTDAEAEAFREALKQKMQELHIYDGELEDVDTGDVDDAFANMTVEEQNAYIREYHAMLQAKSQHRAAALQLPFRIGEDGWVEMSDTVRFRVTDTRALTEEGLLADGFIKFETTQGGYVFMRDSLDTESIRDKQIWICSYVDFESGRYIEIRQTSPLGYALKSPALRADDGDGDGDGFFATVAAYYGKVQDLVKYINLVSDELFKKSLEPIEAIEKMLAGHLIDQKNVGNMIKRYKGDKWSWEYITLLADKKATDISVATSKTAKAIAGPLCRKILGLFSVADVLKTAYDIYSTIDEVRTTYKSIPEPCPNDQQNADSLQENCAWFITTTVGKGIFDMYSSISSAIEIISGFFSAVGTAGTSLAVSGAGIATKIGQFALDLVIDWGLNKWKKSIKDGVKELKCKTDCKPGEQCPKSECPPPPPGKEGAAASSCCKGEGCGPGGPPNGGGGGGGSATGVQDPSGYVYEATLANRVEGATATIFERVSTEDMYGDTHTEAVVWDATPFAQQNPLITDDAGMYGWDVPDGLWQVRIEKTGYEPAQTAWLPVPPPQLEVNIPLRNLSQPQVAEVKAYETGVVIDFSKFMKASTLSICGPSGTIDGATILVSRDGNYFEGTLELISPEEDAETAEPLARRVRFVPAKKFTAGTVTLTVTPNVRCYADIPMADVFQQTFTVEAEPKQFVCDELVILERGASRNVTVQVLPASAAKGRQVRVHIASRTLAAITGAPEGELLLTPDAQGRVTFEVASMLPGNTAIDVTLPGTDLRSVIDVRVMDIFPGEVAAPVASIPTNSELEPGTTVQLYCMTPDVKIYYTLDNSCPCTNVKDRKLYDGTPIVIEKTTILKTMAIGTDDTESAVSSFYYYVFDPSNITTPTDIHRPAERYGIDGVRRSDKAHGGIFVVGSRKQYDR